MPLSSFSVVCGNCGHLKIGHMNRASFHTSSVIRCHDNAKLTKYLFKMVQCYLQIYIDYDINRYERISHPFAEMGHNLKGIFPKLSSVKIHVNHNSKWPELFGQLENKNSLSVNQKWKCASTSQNNILHDAHFFFR